MYIYTHTATHQRGFQENDHPRQEVSNERKSHGIYLTSCQGCVLDTFESDANHVVRPTCPKGTLSHVFGLQELQNTWQAIVAAWRDDS